MSATIYRDPDYGGEFQRLGPGVHYGRGLVGQGADGRAGYELANEISSLRVDRNTIVTLHASQGPGVGSGADGARVVVGPAAVPDLGAIGMDDRVSRVEVHPFIEEGTWGGAPVDYGAGVLLFSDYNARGRQTLLPEGSYSAARLASAEIEFLGRARSLVVSPGYTAILYATDVPTPTSPATAVPGPARIDDLERIGLGGGDSTVRSVRVVRSAGSGPPVAGAFVPPRPLGEDSAGAPIRTYPVRLLRPSHAMRVPTRTPQRRRLPRASPASPASPAPSNTHHGMSPLAAASRTTDPIIEPDSWFSRYGLYLIILFVIAILSAVVARYASLGQNKMDSSTAAMLGPPVSN